MGSTQNSISIGRLYAPALDRAGATGAVVGAAKVVQPVLEQIEGVTATLTSVSDSVAPLIDPIKELWPVLLLLGAAAAVFFAWRARSARIADHQSGKTA